MGILVYRLYIIYDDARVDNMMGLLIDKIKKMYMLIMIDSSSSLSHNCAFGVFLLWGSGGVGCWPPVLGGGQPSNIIVGQLVVVVLFLLLSLQLRLGD